MIYGGRFKLSSACYLNVLNAIIYTKAALTRPFSTLADNGTLEKRKNVTQKRKNESM